MMCREMVIKVTAITIVVEEVEAVAAEEDLGQVAILGLPLLIRLFILEYYYLDLDSAELFPS